MVIQCPKCKTKFKAPEDKLKPGVKLKCSKCGHIFSYQPEEKKELKDNLDLDNLDETPNSKKNEERPVSNGEKKQDVSDKYEQAKKYRVEIDTEETPKSGKKKFIILAIILLVLFAIGGSAYFFFPQIKSFIVPNSQKKNSNLEKKLQEEKVKNIALENVKQYFVKNIKIGELFVIEGEAINRFNTTKELIKIKAVIYDKSGKVVKQKEFFAGNTASLYQLQMLTKKELEDVLNSKIGILTHNTFVKPGGRVPFMVVFYNPPKDVDEFGIEVIDVKNPPKTKK
ncbi:MAG: DUF3426 domain-containing protein [Desulfonauticus sp.]|nr:DUF3426 domain-containing protein [Desulfonauticus sp.]